MIIAPVLGAVIVAADGVVSIVNGIMLGTDVFPPLSVRVILPVYGPSLNHGRAIVHVPEAVTMPV